MNNLVRINYHGTEIVGQIIEIQSVWNNSGRCLGDTSNGLYDGLAMYLVTVEDCKLHTVISNIVIHDISEIEILREVENKNG